MKLSLYRDYIDIGVSNSDHFSLLSSFGIDIPNSYYVAGEDEYGYMSLYNVTQVVEGKNLNELVQEGLKIDDATMVLYYNLADNLIAYLNYCYSRNEPVLFDIINLDQYVYSPKDNKIYMVDTDFSVANIDGEVLKAMVTRIQENCARLLRQTTT